MRCARSGRDRLCSAPVRRFSRSEASRRASSRRSGGIARAPVGRRVRPPRTGASRGPRTASVASLPQHILHPMLLVVDVGNTQTHFGVFEDGRDELAEDWRFATVPESTADQLGAALSNLLALRGLGFEQIDASIVSSTVPQLSDQWTSMAERYLGHQMLVVGPTIRTGIPIRMDQPHEVGA